MRRMYSKEQLQKLIDEVSRLIAIEELDKVVPLPALDKAGYVMTVNVAGTGYELKNISGVVDGATIRPANVFATTKITAAEIVEDMSGYSAEINSSQSYVEIPYVSAVKTGNKLSLVETIKLNLPADTTISDYTVLASVSFTIPSAVANKIYPLVSTRVEQKEIVVFANDYLDYSILHANVSKSGNSITIIIYGSDTANAKLTREKDYAARYELTLLLNDSLIPNE